MINFYSIKNEKDYITIRINYFLFGLYVTGYYRGRGNPNAKFLKGRNTGYNVGISFWNVGNSEDFYGINPIISEATGNVIKYEKTIYRGELEDAFPRNKFRF